MTSATLVTRLNGRHYALGFPYRYDYSPRDGRPAGDWRVARGAGRWTRVRHPAGRLSRHVPVGERGVRGGYGVRRDAAHPAGRAAVSADRPTTLHDRAVHAAVLLRRCLARGVWRGLRAGTAAFVGGGSMYGGTGRCARVAKCAHAVGGRAGGGAVSGVWGSLAALRGWRCTGWTCSGWPFL